MVDSEHHHCETLSFVTIPTTLMDPNSCKHTAELRLLILSLCALITTKTLKCNMNSN